MGSNTEKNKRLLKKELAVIFIWSIFLLLNIVFYVKTIIPSHIYYTINNPYTMDSVWDKEENEWHNDALFNTLFSKNTVYVNPESWYADYIAAFAENVVFDEKIEALVEKDEMLEESYICLNHIIAVQNNTLFDDETIELISSRASDGAALLYIEEKSATALTDGIVFLHDECGNVYLKGYL